MTTVTRQTKFYYEEKLSLNNQRQSNRQETRSSSYLPLWMSNQGAILRMHVWENSTASSEQFDLGLSWIWKHKNASTKVNVNNSAGYTTFQICNWNSSLNSWYLTKHDPFKTKIICLIAD